jgi:hypothetical protein
MNFRHHPPTTVDVDALHAQLCDGIVAPDGVLTFEQAVALINEVRLLRAFAVERDANIGALEARVSTLMGMLS